MLPQRSPWPARTRDLFAQPSAAQRQQRQPQPQQAEALPPAAAGPRTVSCTIPGEPVGKGRPRASARLGKVRMHTPARTAAWEGRAQQHMAEAMRVAGLSAPLDGPLVVEIEAVFELPPSHHLKTRPRPSMPHTKKPDADNVCKIVGDAGNAVMWRDDSLWWRVTYTGRVGAQGEAPYVRVTITESDLIID